MGTLSLTCCVDLKGSLEFVADSGRKSAVPVIGEHLRICKALAERNNGRTSNGMQDKLLVHFNGVDNALSFAAQLQQLCSPRPGQPAKTVAARVSISLGAVDASAEHVVGHGVDGAVAAIERLGPGEVVIDKGIYQTCSDYLGPDKTAAICSPVNTTDGMQTNRHVEDERYQFNWKEFVTRTPDASIGKHILNHCKKAHIELSNVTERDLSCPGHIIWPVVPRDLATAIHRGQIELIRLMVNIGWSVNVLIADCGGEHEYEDSYVDKFQNCLAAAALNRDIVFTTVQRMSALYDPSYERYRCLQGLFRKISTTMTVDELMEINNKGYSADDITRNNAKPTLAYIRPPLTIAAVLHLAHETGTKCVVVSGRDESQQWKQAYNIPNALSRIGALMIPVIKMDRKHQLLQKERWPIWHSEADIVRHISEAQTNTAWWIYCLHAFLPAFPEEAVRIGGATISPEDWKTECAVPEGWDPQQFVGRVWPLLNPA